MKNKLDVWIYLVVAYSSPLADGSVLILVSRYFGHCNFVVYFEVRHYCSAGALSQLCALSAQEGHAH